MAVDPQVQVLLDALTAAGGPRFPTMNATEARAWFASFRRPFAVPIHAVEDRTIPGSGGPVPVRLYTPQGAPAVAPLLVYFHGGGWVVGDLESHDAVCRSLANASRCKVLAVDYRLAPEHSWPAAPDDCWTVVQWVVAHAVSLGVDAQRLAVGGDSAGGNLAAVVTQRARAAQGPHIAFQLLIYPAVDASMRLPSIDENRTGYFLEKVGMQWFYHHYIPPGISPTHPDISPLHTTDLASLPPAYVVTAGYDPLRDEGHAYAEKLRTAGVAVEYRNYPGMIHGFFGFQPMVEVARQAVQDAGHALTRALA